MSFWSRFQIFKEIQQAEEKEIDLIDQNTENALSKTICISDFIPVRYEHLNILYPVSLLKYRNLLSYITSLGATRLFVICNH